MSRVIPILAFLSLTACSTGAVTASGRHEPSAPVGSFTSGRDSSETFVAKTTSAPVREVHVAQHAREPMAWHFQCRSCVR